MQENFVVVTETDTLNRLLLYAYSVANFGKEYMEMTYYSQCNIWHMLKLGLHRSL